MEDKVKELEERVKVLETQVQLLIQVAANVRATPLLYFGGGNWGVPGIPYGGQG